MSEHDRPQQDDEANLPVAIKAERYAAQVLNKDRLEILAKSMPEHVQPDRFKRNLVTAVAHHPDLLLCQPAEVFLECGKASALGFYLDPALGEAYLITGWNSKLRRKVPQLRIGYRGLQKLGRQSGELLGTPYAHEVCERDTFKVVQGTKKYITHELPDGAGMWDRGPVMGYYAVMVFKDGTSDFEVMGHEAIERIRDRSDGWKAFKTGKIQSTPWSTDYDEMAKKTVLRRLMKRVPTSPEMAEALRIEDADYVDADGAPLPPRLTPAERLRQRRLAHVGPGFDQGHVARELGQGPAEDTSAAQGAESGPSVDDGGLDLAQPCSECGAAEGVECAPACSAWNDLDPESWPDHVRAARAEPGPNVQPNTFTESAGAVVDAAQAAAAAADEDVVDTEVEDLGPTAHPTDTDGAPHVQPEPDTSAPAGDASSAGPAAPDSGRSQQQAPQTQQAGAPAAPAKPPTLAERAATYEAKMRAAPSSVVLKRLLPTAKQLLADLDKADPERRVELDQLHAQLLDQLETAEREGR